MSWFFTITAFSVIIPFVVGVWHYRQMPTAFHPIVWLLGAWTLAEVYSYILRINAINNAHISFVLTAIEVFLFCVFYGKSSSRLSGNVAGSIVITGIILVCTEYIFTSGEFSTYSITFEYIVVASLSFFLYYEHVMQRASSATFGINLTILFYLLCSFPYFFAYEWLRITNMHALMVLATIYAVMHSICYLILAYLIWKSSSLSLARS